MSVTQIVGVDPGIVHTGVVRMTFFPDIKEIAVAHAAIEGKTTDEHVDAAKRWIGGRTHAGAQGWIEDYRPRSAFSTDKRMGESVALLRRALPGFKVLDNSGIKKRVKPATMELLGVWDFSTPTHHQDLRSAARIAILGMLKDPALNRLLGDVVLDHLNGKDWAIVQH